MFARRLTLAVGVWIAVAGCASRSDPDAGLTRQERALVDTYVRITVLDAWRADDPDSVGPALDRLAQSYDSTAVRAAVAALDANPQRWEPVFDAIAKRLADLEKEPTPRIMLRRLEGLTRARADSLSREAPARSPATPRSP